MRQGLAEPGRQSTALPAEIAFLARHGYPPQILREAALIGERTGASADQVLLKHGLVEEQDFYRALAAELHLPFLPSPRLSPDARYPDSILTGLAPLMRGGFVLAPQGETLARLLGTATPARSLAITAPSLLGKAVFQAQRRMIAYHAALDLPHTFPTLSSYTSASTAQIAGAALVAFLLSFCGIVMPDLITILVTLILCPLFLCMIVLRLAASLLHHPLQEGDTREITNDDAALPVYTIIVALYRERRVASRLIAALRRLDYPPAKLDIKLVLEEDDRETIPALEALRLPGNVEIILAPRGEPRTKPRALNVALPLARGPFTVVYDAEDMPASAQLRLAVAAFARSPQNVACLQARLTIDNTDDSWLTRLFTIEYAALFDVFNPGLAEIGSPLPLGGTSNHFRTAILKRVHGWDAWNVTEDADLGIRLARFGYHVADLPSSTLEEAPITLGAWMRQRTRWMKGYMQTSISHSRHPASMWRQLGFWRSYASLALTGGAVLSALIYPFCTALFVVRWISGPAGREDGTWDAAWQAWSLTLFVSGTLSLFIPALLALHRRSLWRLLPWAALLPFYYMLVSIAAWRGLWELVMAPFQWNKTQHGLARTSRSGVLQKHHANVAKTMSLKIAPP